MMGDMSRRKFTHLVPELFAEAASGGLGGKDSNKTKFQSFKTRNGRVV